jgi:hypothetical protein
MRSGGEALSGGPILQERHQGHGRVGDTATSDRDRRSCAHQRDTRRTCRFPVCTLLRSPRACGRPPATSQWSPAPKARSRACGRAPSSRRRGSWSCGWCCGRPACVAGTIWRARCPASGAETARRAGSAPAAPGRCRLWRGPARVVCCRSHRAHPRRRHSVPRRPGSSNFGMGRSVGEVLRTHGASLAARPIASTNTVGRESEAYPASQERRRFSIFARRINSITFRLIGPREFVDRRQNSIVLLSNEFFPQVIEHNNGYMLPSRPFHRKKCDRHSGNGRPRRSPS